MVDAAALWSQPETVLSRFGPQAETDLLLALRRGAADLAAAGRGTAAAKPVGPRPRRRLADQLLGPAAEELAASASRCCGRPACWTTALSCGPFPAPAPEKLTKAGFGLAALLEFRWQLTLDGAVLDADEIAAVAEAKRPLIRLRGRWVILDPALLERLRRPPRDADAHVRGARRHARRLS